MWVTLVSNYKEKKSINSLSSPIIGTKVANVEKFIKCDFKIYVFEQLCHVPAFYLIEYFEGHNRVAWPIHVAVVIKDLDMVAHLLN